MFNKKTRRKLDQFRIKEDGYFYIQQKIKVQVKNIFTGKVIEEYWEWEDKFTDSILYLNGTSVGFGRFKTKEQAKEGIKFYREEKGWAKKNIKYHEV